MLSSWLEKETSKRKKRRPFWGTCCWTVVPFFVAMRPKESAGGRCCISCWEQTEVLKREYSRVYGCVELRAFTWRQS